MDVRRLSERLRGASLSERIGLAASAVRGRAVFTTSFGLEDQALLDAIATAGAPIAVATLDTGRLFPETYDLWAATEERYGLRIEVFAPRADSLESLVNAQGINGFRASVEARKACCGIRKVEPLSRALAGAAVWMTGLRAGQSQHRAGTPFAEEDALHGVLKVNPLADFSRATSSAMSPTARSLQRAARPRLSLDRLRALHARGRAGEPERAGRWWWEDEARRNAGCTATRRFRSCGAAARSCRHERRPFDRRRCAGRLTHLQRLEAESIHIMREVAAECENPVMLYSIGKDSSVLLHLARKAFYPGRLPFPLLHIDTGWKFREMIAFRDRRAERARPRPDRAHQSRTAWRAASGRSRHGSRDPHRRDEDAGPAPGARPPRLRCRHRRRAPRRGEVTRQGAHLFVPQRASSLGSEAPAAEPWRLYNTRKRRGESMRVFPLSNWTELDIWLYIHARIFRSCRSISPRRGRSSSATALLIMVDDDRCRSSRAKLPQTRAVRFRTLGCYPLTGAVESEAATFRDIIARNARRRAPPNGRAG